MTKHLRISVTFLDEFHGPEWPPSPMRLFQALLAGAHVGARRCTWSNAKADAFRWLERRGPPDIFAPPAQKMSAHIFYVPNNDGDEEFDRQYRLAGKVEHPHHMIGDQTVHYIWEIKDEEWGNTPADIVCKECRNLVALGWGIDVAIGNGQVLDKTPSPSQIHEHWLPWNGWSTGMLRVPCEGTLTDLEKSHQSFLKRIDGKNYSSPKKPSVFGEACYMKAGSLPPRPYAAFALQSPLGISSRPSYRVQDTMCVAAMLRHVTCTAALADSHDFPGGSEQYVAGHAYVNKENMQRFSYLPLPSIGGPYADGKIRRVLIAEPYASDGSHARWSQRLHGKELRSEDGQISAVLARINTNDSVVDRYCRASTHWNSVTPVILPGYDDHSYEKAQQLLVKALKHAGVRSETCVDIVLRKAPFWHGSHHPRLYRLPSHLKGRSMWHVHLHLRDPIPGPLAIGSGRHCGLGLFASE